MLKIKLRDTEEKVSFRVANAVVEEEVSIEAVNCAYAASRNKAIRRENCC